MIDIKLLRENPEKIKEASESKNININIDIEKILGADKKVRELDASVQKLREDRNKAAKEKNIEKGKKIKDELDKLEKELNSEKEVLYKLLLEIPNLPAKDVKAGKDESENEVVRKFMLPSDFSFTARDHLDIGEDLNLIDVKSAAKVSGTRFSYLKNEAVLLEFALAQYAFENLVKEGFIPIVPPVLIRKEITDGLGYWNGGGNEDYYLVSDPSEKSEYYLVGTAEHSIVPFHKDEVLNKRDLPKRYLGFSSAFRREAGSYGKDTRGIFRVHQFDKIEMVSFVAEENDDKEHEYLLGLEEKLWQGLEIPYQVVKMCTGDLGFPIARKYDIEAWMPSQKKYREVTSVSTATDFQSRRLNIKYNDGGKKRFVHILNGTAFAIGRTIVAILENYQREDGSVEIPKVLQKYLGKEFIEK